MCQVIGQRIVVFYRVRHHIDISGRDIDLRAHLASTQADNTVCGVALRIAGFVVFEPCTINRGFSAPISECRLTHATMGSFVLEIAWVVSHVAVQALVVVNVT